MLVQLFLAALGFALHFGMQPVASFQAIIPQRNQEVTLSSTALRYTIIGPPDEEQEQDPHAVGDSQHHFTPTTKQTAHNGGVQDLSNYRDYDEILETEDTLNIDSFSHASGASIMPGFHLSALCGDD
jgi:hypothetical protein